MELVATEGHWLTQANLKENEQRGFWRRMHLAYSLTEADFVEWTNEQREQWESEHPQTEDIE